ncbi:MAG: hypothetical protein JWM78_1469 [Verrucomicrobiaceae bacterium]|nr:hypothetical protein [Verrucomicrobiaceae bacterium]
MQRRSHETLAGQIVAGVTLIEMTDHAILGWIAVEAALKPIIGDNGFEMLLKRCIQITSASHAWLRAAGKLPCDDNFSALETLFLQQSAGCAAAGADALFQNFHKSVCSLIGTALTNQILRSVPINFSDDRAQETSL